MKHSFRHVVIAFGLCFIFIVASSDSHADSHKSVSAKVLDISHIDKVLTQLHHYASEANGSAYFSSYADNAVFIGTDVGERWPIQAFKDYAMPIFDQGRGWTYHKRERNIFVTDDGKTAWFDEILDSDNYGTSRGTGVLIKTDEGWKISQYHLTFPIPNDLAKGFTDQIKTFEAEAKKSKMSKQEQP